MIKHTLYASIAVIAVALARPALSQIRGVTIPLGVYDAKNNWLGTLLTPATLAAPAQLIRPYNGNWYSLEFTTDGIDGPAPILHTSRDCSGNGYSNYLQTLSELPSPAFFDGQNIWGATNTQTTINIGSYALEGSCYAYQFTGEQVMLLQLLDSSAGRFVPPFAVR